MLKPSPVLLLMRFLPAGLLFLLSIAGVAPLSAQEKSSLPAPGPPPLRSVCVVDPESKTGLRLDSLVVERIPYTDSVVTRNGTRQRFHLVRPRIAGYAAPPRGLPADTTYLLGGDSYEWVKILGYRYMGFSPPRPADLDELVPIGEVQGVTVFIRRGGSIRNDPEHLFVLLEPDCLMQLYASPEAMR